MVSVDSKINISAQSDAVDPGDQLNRKISDVPKSEIWFLLRTFITTTGVFGIFFVQGILLARVLGPEGRGEFGSVVLFAQQLLLYVGLLGGIEIVNRYAKKPGIDVRSLKYRAASLGWLTGLLTACVSFVLAVIVFGFFETEKAYLIPFCFLAGLFVPFEHIHLTISGVDRGTDSYTRYNINRLVFASVFPICLLALYFAKSFGWGGENLLLIVCFFFVVARVIGLLPTLRGLTFSEWWSDGTQSSSQTVPSRQQLMHEGTPYAWSMFATELFERLDLLLIVLLATVKEAGFYFVAVPAAALLTIGPNALSVFTFNAGASNRKVSLRQATTIVVLTAVFQMVSLAVLWVSIPWLIVFFYGGDFEPALKFASYLLPACAIKGFIQPLDGYLKGCGKPFIGVCARGISIVAMLTFVWFAYDSNQLYSIPMAACFGQAISMVVIATFVFREILIRNDEVMAS